MTAALTLWCATAIAGAPDYDAFSDPDGHIATVLQELAAWKMMRDPDQLEAVFADAVKGNERAIHVVQQLEATLSASGRKVAERVSRAECLVPGAQQVVQSCRPDWTFLDFLSMERPGGVRLRLAIFSAFATRAHELGLQNQAILSAINGLLSIAFAGALLAHATAVGNDVILNVTRLKDAELATGRRLSRKLGAQLAESPHLGADFVDAAGRTYDVLGVPAASKYWNEKAFTRAINEHLLKANDFTVIDLTGFTPEQIAIVQRHLGTLKPEQLLRIIRLGF